MCSPYCVCSSTDKMIYWNLIGSFLTHDRIHEILYIPDKFGEMPNDSGELLELFKANNNCI